MLISLILKSTLHPLTISLIILGCLFVITFLFFSIVFAIHCNSLHIQYRLEEKFNKIKQFLAINKFKYLETLSKSNVQLKDLMMDINNAKQLYEEQLEVVRQKIISLTLINARYLYLRSHRLANEIKKDLKKCNAMMKNLRNVSISATQYSKDVSDLLIEYRQITDDVTHFYEFNLALRYDNQLFKKMRETIKDAICQATEYVLKFNNDKLLVILHSLDQKISSYYKIILQVYTFDRILMYLESLRKRIKSLLDNAAKILSNTDYSQIETTFANGSSNTTQLETNLKSMNFGAARINAIVAVKQLSDALAKIEMGDQTNVLIQKDMVMLKNQIAVLTKEFNELNTALNNIQKNFRNVNDSSIINKITILNGEIKAIILSYQNLENEYKNYHLIQRNEFLIKIKELSNSMLAWKLKLFNINEEVQIKYRNAILVNDELADIKLTLTQLLGMKSQFKNIDQKNIDTIKNIIEHIQLLQKQLSENYFQNYSAVNEELIKIREQTTLLISSPLYGQTLKIYAQRLIGYVNKYRNEHDEIEKSLNLAEGFYKKGEYQNTIEQMIETVSTILTSAKESKISFN